MKNFFLCAFAAFALLAGPLATSAAADDHAAAEEVSAKTLFEGVWTRKSNRVAGDWSIVEKNGKTYVKLSEDFRTRNGPDLKIFLSPLSASEANGRNATNGSVLVAPLSSNAGAQMYEIPGGVNLASFQSILIHCEAFSKLWSAADLT